MALIRRGAGHWIAADADPRLAGIGLSTGVTVIASCAIGLDGVRALPGRWIACTGRMALIASGADDSRATGADSGLTGVAGRTGVSVIAGGAIRFRHVCALSRCWVACPRRVTLVRSQADDGIAADTGPSLTGIRLRTQVAIVAGGPVRLRWIGANASRGIAGSRVVALVGGGADDRVTAHADSSLTRVGLGAGIAIVARCPIRLRRVRALTGLWVTGTSSVTLVKRSAGDGRTAGTDS
jgi:hypothetical protein